MLFKSNVTATRAKKETSTKCAFRFGNKSLELGRLEHTHPYDVVRQAQLVDDPASDATDEPLQLSVLAAARRQRVHGQRRQQHQRRGPPVPRQLYRPCVGLRD